SWPRTATPRFITIRRRGTLTDSDHRLLALWAAACAEHVLHFFESVQPSDPRPRQAIEQIRAWARGEIRMSRSRAAGGHARAVAQRDLLVGVRMLTGLQSSYQRSSMVMIGCRPSGVDHVSAASRLVVSPSAPS